MAVDATLTRDSPSQSVHDIDGKLDDVEAQTNVRRGSDTHSLRGYRAPTTGSDSTDTKREKSSGVAVVQDTTARDPAFLVGFDDPNDPENPKVCTSWSLTSGETN